MKTVLNWNSTKNKNFPDPKKEVIVCDDDGDYYMGHFVEDLGKYQQWDTNGEAYIGEVIYWAEITGPAKNLYHPETGE